MEVELLNLKISELKSLLDVISFVSYFKPADIKDVPGYENFLLLANDIQTLVTALTTPPKTDGVTPPNT